MDRKPPLRHPTHPITTPPKPPISSKFRTHLAKLKPSKILLFLLTKNTAKPISASKMSTRAPREKRSKETRDKETNDLSQEKLARETPRPRYFRDETAEPRSRDAFKQLMASLKRLVNESPPQSIQPGGGLYYGPGISSPFSRVKLRIMDTY